MTLTFSQVSHAWQVQDPTLVDKLLTLASQPDPTIDKPIPEDELTFERFLSKIFSVEFREKHPEVQFAERVAMIAKLEADEGVYPLPDRFKIHLILTALWDDGSAYSRQVLKQAIARLPLSYGVWKGFKYIYKQAEFLHDYEIFGCLSAKIDAHRFDNSMRTPVSKATKTYMSLRAWRYLRTLGHQLPVCYIEASCAVLVAYDEDITLNGEQQRNSWVLNHICFHNSKEQNYGVSRFGYKHRQKLFDNKSRAFAEAWQQDPEPLFTVLKQAKNEAVRQFATDSLKHDFQTQLRDVSVQTIQELSSGHNHSQARDEMIVWLLTQSPNFEKARFSELGLHTVVIKLLYSDNKDAYEYAISYAKSYAQDLPLNELMFLAISEHASVRKFAIEQILSRDPRKDVGIEGWGQLLDTDYHHKVAGEQLSKHFNRRDLTPEWFFERLISANEHSVNFASKQLPSLYSAKELGADYFINISRYIDVEYNGYGGGYINYHSPYNKAMKQAMAFVLKQLKTLDLNAVDAEVWQRLLLHPLSQDTIEEWINEELITANRLPISFWQALAYETDWNSNEWIQQLIHGDTSTNTNDNTNNDESDNKDTDNPNNKKIATNWQRHLTFNEDLAYSVRYWLSDVRRFAPTQLGFDWLMKLAQSEKSVYREFAIDRINKGFLPADFAPSKQTSHQDNEQPESPTANANTVTTVTVDLSGQRYLFTGKMNSMSRGEAEKLVKEANGSISSAVNNKLDYLVIGDEGSPLYGNGRKGSKQLKAEDLIAKGAELKIISETAFLQMLTGQVREASEDEVLAGANALWHMATDDPTAPISELAISYLSHHHADICLALTDRPVDPDAIIPAEFFSPERVIPLLQHGNIRLREFGLLLSKYELANWQPDSKQWVMMAESTHSEVQELLTQAFISEQTAENRRYHLSPSELKQRLSANTLYALIDSKRRFARQLGITLLQRYPEFQQVETLYYLTQSSDREVRYSAVTMLWQRFKNRHISDSQLQDYQTNKQAQRADSTDTKSNSKNDKQAGKQNDITNTVSPTTTIYEPASSLLENVPADFEQLLSLLRRGLYELPPARLPATPESKAESKANDKQQQKYGKYNQQSKQADEKKAHLKVISASQAKLALIETFRDVALADRSFAQVILPMLYTFTHSAGKMERHACLVAVTRLLNRYPELAEHLQVS
ncbi:BRCT domain-containing protein [Psychrobacter sp. I-STPA10]|uniref:BRCT domain-containing protein n=1 Tax=Psychrobacter sp. I-STPA10 TaxID=2585769 RepID=UPI001E2E2AD2|nr:BRCT domain-containing protein [Psychrobacter sp. I-STPA10]